MTKVFLFRKHQPREVEQHERDDELRGQQAPCLVVERLPRNEMGKVVKSELTAPPE